MTESMFEDEVRLASRSAKDDFGLTPADVTAGRPLLAAPVALAVVLGRFHQ